MRKAIGTLTAVGILGGCASIDFDSKEPGGLQYYEGVPYLLVQATEDCKINTQVLMMPTIAKRLKLNSGVIGSSKLNVSLAQGMISTVGQEADTKLPEMITSITGAYSAAKSTSSKCTGSAMLYEVSPKGTLEPTDTPLPVPIPLPEKPTS